MQAREVVLRCVAAILACLAATAASPALAAPRDDADWPCQQRLMPTLGAGSLWTGPPLDSAGDWTAEPRVAELVTQIAPRNVSAENGVAAISAFAESLAPQDKRRLLTLAFAGVLAETNQERSDLIARLKDLGHRQHELADIASHASEELRSLPAAGAAGDDAAKRADLEQRVAFVTQAFENTQRTMRYACEAPVRLEARLGRYAQAIQSRL
jgi:hypothetical protein